MSEINEYLRLVEKIRTGKKSKPEMEDYVVYKSPTPLCVIKDGEITEINLNQSFAKSIFFKWEYREDACGWKIYNLHVATERLMSFNTTHGLSKSPLYHVWGLMKKRCYDENDPGYKNYGGRGIIICDEWRNNFVSFYHWGMSHGYQKGLDIDREKNNLGYSPDNCRFVTGTINAQNTRLIKSNNTSGYRGVCFHKLTEKWQASIRWNNKHYHLGLFSTPELAAQAYNYFVIENKTSHPLNIILNF